MKTKILFYSYISNSLCVFWPQSWPYMKIVCQEWVKSHYLDQSSCTQINVKALQHALTFKQSISAWRPRVSQRWTQVFTKCTEPWPIGRQKRHYGAKIVFYTHRLENMVVNLCLPHFHTTVHCNKVWHISWTDYSTVPSHTLIADYHKYNTVWSF